MDPKLRRQLNELPTQLSVQTQGNRPIAFASAAPEPVSRPSDLEHVALLEESDPFQAGQSNAPVAVLDMIRTGIPPSLMETLQRRGVTTLTPLQAKLLQHTYALQDVIVSGPTGSGKTFGLCVAVIARLLRQGPMALMSSLILTPSVILARQIEKWLHELWRFPDDKRLVLCATEDMSVKQLSTFLRTTPRPGDYVSAPYVVVTTPEIIWPCYSQIHERKLHSPTRKASAAAMKVIPSLESVFIDEVDQVLPANDRSAPGNRLMNDLITRNHFEAPLQTIMTSATLTPTAANHARHFLRKSIFALQTASILDDATQQQGVAQRRLLCSANVTHKFYVATSFDEQADCISHAVAQWAKAEDETARTGGNDESLEESIRRQAKRVRAVVIVSPSADVKLIQHRVLEKLKPLAWRVLPITKSTRSVTFEDSDAEGDEGAPQAVLLPSDLVRGIDVMGATHVIIMTQPKTATDYVHWSGRVGRMGASGVAITLLRKHEVRPVSDFCESLELSFKIERRLYEAFDTRAVRGTLDGE